MSNLSDVMTLPLQIPETIPNDWSWRNLVELCNPKQWKTISNSDLTETGYRVFGANGFIGYYHEFNHEDETISVTCRGATCGTVNLIPPRTYITGNSMCLDNLSREVSKFYLFYATQFRTFSDVISGSAQPQITGEGLKKVSLPIPPLPEQKKIASILTSVDEVIENTQKQIDKLQDLKTATMNELLTKGIGHTEFKDSELGRIPKSWEIGRFDDFITLQRGHDLPTQDRKKGVIPIFGSNGIVGFHENSIIEQTGVITGRSGSIGDVHFVKGLYWALNTTLYVKDFHENDAEFISHYLRFFELDRFATGTGVPTLNRNDVHNQVISFPPLEEQLKICEAIGVIESLLATVAMKLSQTQSLKKSLMQDLLTGRVRVNP